MYLFKFNNNQLLARRFKTRRMHQMCHIEGFNSVDLKLAMKEHIKKVKVYEKLCHKVLSVILKDKVDNLPKMVQTICTRFDHMTLFQHSKHMHNHTHRLHVLDTRIEVTIGNVNKVINAHKVCNDFRNKL